MAAICMLLVPLDEVPLVFPKLSVYLETYVIVELLSYVIDFDPGVVRSYLIAHASR